LKGVSTAAKAISVPLLRSLHIVTN